jgi:hypothetical protein
MRSNAMKSRDEKTIADRRGFLRLAALGAVGGGASVASGVATAGASEKPEAKGQLYRETEHIKKYYELARG